MQEITKEHIQNSLKIVRVDEKAYMNELVVYQLHFESYKYDHVTSKLVEVPINVFQKLSPMQATIVATSYRNEFVVITNEEPKPIRGRTEMAIISYTLPLPTKLVEVPIVIISI
jgi:hypothetical protein